MKPSAKYCVKPTTEIKLNAILSGLFFERQIPAGSILDVGALDGAFAAYYACLAPDRKVYAVDPSPANVESYRKRYTKAYPNIQPFNAALGEFHGAIPLTRLPRVMNGRFAQFSDISAHMEKNLSFPASVESVEVYSVDDLLQKHWQGERLGFAHIDVEGSELAVLRGMTNSVKAYGPVLTVEVHVHFDVEFTKRLLSYMEWLGYDTFLVEESCGMPLVLPSTRTFHAHSHPTLTACFAGMRMDCRNLLGLPRRSPIQDSNILDLAVASRSLVRVNASSIFQEAYPCCRPGGACCPTQSRGAKVLGDPSCCYWRHVRRHLQQLLSTEVWKNNLDDYPLHTWIAGAGSWEKQRKFRWNPRS